MEEQFKDMVACLEDEFKGYKVNLILAKREYNDFLSWSIILENGESHCDKCGSTLQNKIEHYGALTFEEALAEIREKMKGLEAV